MWTFQTVAITIVAIIIYAIYAHFSYDPSSPTTSGGKALKKATTAALNMDLIKSVYKKIKG
jgi:hypothetical protein